MDQLARKLKEHHIGFRVKRVGTVSKWLDENNTELESSSFEYVPVIEIEEAELVKLNQLLRTNQGFMSYFTQNHFKLENKPKHDDPFTAVLRITKPMCALNS